MEIGSNSRDYIEAEESLKGKPKDRGDNRYLNSPTLIQRRAINKRARRLRTIIKNNY